MFLAPVLNNYDDDSCVFTITLFDTNENVFFFQLSRLRLTLFDVYNVASLLGTLLLTLSKTMTTVLN